jgi:hypothetical protein
MHSPLAAPLTGYLTKQSSLQIQGLLGINLDQWNASELVKDSDRLIVVAYPSFNPKVDNLLLLEPEAGGF